MEDKLKIYESTYKKINSNKSKYKKQMLKWDNELELTESDSEDKGFRNLNGNKRNESINDFSFNSELASSGYSTLNINSEPEDNIDIPIKINNNISTIKIKEEIIPTSIEQITPVIKEEKHDRSKNNNFSKVTRNQITLKSRTQDEVDDFQRQELERYKSAHLPYTYTSLSGLSSVVAPILKKPPTSTSNKPREHVMLKQDRPYFVTILCLARDAAARLNDGLGTRADICDLLKDSQYMNESLTDAQVNLNINT